MTIERLEELTREYLQKMNSRVNKNLPDKENNDLAMEYEGIKHEFVNILPGILEKYSKYFEFNPMHEEIELSSADVIQKIYERIIQIKRKMEQGKDIDRFSEQKENQDVNFGRSQQIKQILQDAFIKVEHEMRRREFNINWDTLKIYCNRIISNHMELIEKNVFQKNEDDTVKEEVQRYIEEVKQELSVEKSEDMKLEFDDGSICPVVTDTTKFAKANKKIADNIQVENSQNDKTKIENKYGVLGPIL